MNRKARRCCGIDVHKASLSACIRLQGKGRKVSEEIRTFGTTGDELLALPDWLKEHEVSEVAMEATGVYWKPVYYVLEDGLRVILVNPAEIKRMPGRKTDVSDCAWLAQLLDHGMLRPSFIPPREIRELRDLVRYRVSLKHGHTRIANRLHKVLQDADLKLSSVMSDILGVSGRQILSQLAKGNCDPVALADLARANLRGKLPQLRQALSGRFNAHHAFLLSRLLADLDNTEEAMAQVAERIEAQLVPFAAELERLCTIPGVKQVAAAAILAEIGTDMSQFPSTADLDSWAGMAPGNNQSGGKRHRAKARKGNRWLRTILVESGNAAGRTRNTALSALYRRMIVRGGRKHAAFVVGRHILNIAYHFVNTGMKVHQHSEAKIHQFESRWLGGLVSGRGSARGINPLAAAKIKFGE